MQKFCKFVHLKLTFSILHSHFYKTPTSVCLLYTFIQIKYYKPSHYKPDKYPAIINPINTHQNPLIKIINCVTTKSNSSSSYQVKQDPQASASVLIVASAGPTHHVPESSATASFLGLMHCGLPVNLNKTPPLWFACWSQQASSFSFLLSVLLF